MVLKDERMEELEHYSFSDSGTKFNGLEYQTALVGGFDKTGEVYYLTEIAFLGNKVRVIGEYKSHSEVEDTPDLFGGWLKDEAFWEREYADEDMGDVFKLFFEKGEKINAIVS